VTTTITAANGAGSTSPVSIIDYDAGNESRNIVHDLIGGGIAVALIAPRPRAGDMQLLYTAEADAWAAQALHRQETTFSLTDSVRTGIGMTYVLAPGGNARVTYDKRNEVWVVTVPYQEVET